jgi:hypothetical protein
MVSLINEAYRPGPGIIIGQKMTEGQCVTISVPLALQLHICRIIGITKDTGGHNQFVSLDQF